MRHRTPRFELVSFTGALCLSLAACDPSSTSGAARDALATDDVSAGDAPADTSEAPALPPDAALGSDDGAGEADTASDAASEGEIAQQLDADDSGENDAAGGGILALFEGSAPAWGLSPWPDDRMRAADGALRLDGFDTIGNDFAIAYRDLVEAEVRGFARMPVVYFPLSDSPSAIARPTPAETRGAGSPIRLIAFPDDSTCTTQVPVEVELFDADSPFLPVPALMATPVHGHELAPLTRYAAVIDAVATTPTAGRTPAFEAAWNASEGALAALRACLGAEAGEVVAATVFTTADSTRELAEFVDHVQSAAVELPELRGWARVDGQSNATREVRAGTLEMPIYQVGAPPYDTPGSGGLAKRSGVPEVQRRESAPVTIAWRPDGPAEGRPVLVWVGGTGIRQYGHLADEPVKAALADGFVVVSTLPQFHGSRQMEGVDTVMSTFNYFNPAAGRSVLRQQAIEAAFLARWVRASLASLEGVPGVDTTRLTYGGHSQGALAGSLLAGVSDTFAGWVFGGLGGHMSTTLVERKDYFDIQELVALAFGEPTHLITRFHPIVQLAQVTGDVVDPASYVRHWRGGAAGHAGSHTFVVNASADATTPVRSVDVVTIASGSAVTGEAVWDFDPFDVGAATVTDGPVSGNVTSARGAPLSAISWLFTGGDHFELLNRPAVGVAAAAFLRAAQAGEVPVFSRPVAQPAP